MTNEDTNNGNENEAQPQPEQKPASPKLGPQLVVEKLPFESKSGVAYKWRVEHDGRLLATGAGHFDDNYTAAQDAANIALLILNTLSTSYCHLARGIEVAQVRARQMDEAAEADKEAE